MSTADMAGTFRQAAEVIRDGGLAMGVYQYGGAHCTVGALMAATRGTVFGVEAEVGYLVDLLGGPDAIESAGTDTSGPVGETLIRGFRTVVRWNDDSDRTADEVVALLEQAAEKLEADR